MTFWTQQFNLECRKTHVSPEELDKYKEYGRRLARHKIHGNGGATVLLDDPRAVAAQGRAPPSWSRGCGRGARHLRWCLGERHCRRASSTRMQAFTYLRLRQIHCLHAHRGVWQMRRRWGELRRDLAASCRPHACGTAGGRGQGRGRGPSRRGRCLGHPRGAPATTASSRGRDLGEGEHRHREELAAGCCRPNPSSRC